ncbi:MAG: peptidoglycan bridge formation glycyltransferase FemA/FemB family protein, partial [Bacteroidales bacterium]|nr:peptidoglycan bridge formation glycyltransferase FemA/FemB family protein [Bacteroidales bacterium]
EESEDVIFSKIERGTRYEINRCRSKDNITIKTLDSASNKESFYQIYDEFAVSKSLPRIRKNEVDLLIKNNMYIIRSCVYDNKKIVYHTYITSGRRVRLAASISFLKASDDNKFRNLIGRANRLLHWDDILYFKNNGYTIYDFGGIGIDATNREVSGINKFKEGFGGIPVKEYKSFIPVSFKGHFYLNFKYFVHNTLLQIKLRFPGLYKLAKKLLRPET